MNYSLSKSRGLLFLALLLAPATIADVVVARGTATYTELPNFHAVNELLYRGAAPKPGGFRRLAALGVTSVVNLRAADDHARDDAARAGEAGLRYFNVPMAGHARPTDAQIARALSIITAPENQPVFVYCRRGADRTGTVIAAHRISREGWTSGEAKAEANRHGMSATQFEMKDYITDYYCRGAVAAGNGENCADRRLVDRVGTPAATIARRLVEGIRRHTIARGGARRLMRWFGR